MKQTRYGKPLLWGLFFIVVFSLYLFGANQQRTLVNNDRTKSDQRSVMHAAQFMVESNYTFQTDRNRMPLYSFLHTIHYEIGMKNKQFFEQAKLLNIALSVVCLLALSFIFYKLLPPHPTINLLLIVMFFLYMYRAAYVQSELLFYFLAFVSYILLIRLLLKPDWKWAIITGIILGLTHLTKASILPAIALFVGVALLQEATAVVQRHRAGRAGQAAPKRSFSAATHLITIALTVGVFLLTVSPYIINSKRIFGQYFYNVNSTFYMWYDTWGEAKAGTRAHGDRVGWPDMPAEDIPGPVKYVQTHTPQEMGMRLYNGLADTITETRGSSGYFNYFVLYSLIGLVTIMVFYRRTAVLFKTYFFPLLFMTAYFLTYLFIFSWYYPIGVGIRFSQSQYIPYLFTLSYVVFVLYRNQLVISRPTRRLALTPGLNILITLILIPDIYLLLTARITRLWGGS